MQFPDMKHLWWLGVVTVLFLGDNGHHVPMERCRQIYSIFAQRGVDITYTDQVSDLNPATLGRYDGSQTTPPAFQCQKPVNAGQRAMRTPTG